MPQKASSSAPLVLLECLVAGTSHRPHLRQAEAGLKIGQTLFITREPENKYDDWAVQVHTHHADSPDNVWLGYLPEGRNETVARLLDAGFSLSALLNHKAWEDDWLHLDIEVLMNR